MAVGVGEMIGQWLNDNFFSYFKRLIVGILSWFDSMVIFLNIPFQIVESLPDIVQASVLCLLCSLVVIFIIKLVKH